VSDAIWVVGGEQHVSFVSRPEWHLYKTALVLKVEDGKVERVLAYRSPSEHCPDASPSHTFKAATLTADTAYLCTQTEVLLCDFPSFHIRRVISHPCFNDLHHVTPAPDGTLYVAVTGLDAVAQLSPEGEILRLQGILGQDPWERFSPDVDYRKVPTTKPHQAHPNYVFFLAGRPWVTRFEQRDAVPLDPPGEGEEDAPFAIHISTGAGVHDGHVNARHLYFTAVDGHVVRFSLADRKAEGFDLKRLAHPDNDLLGWCRGILPLGGDRAWVGFSRIRFTTLRRNLSWLRHGLRPGIFHDQPPTRIALYDLERPAILDQVDLEATGMGAVFSVHGDPRHEEKQ
jgi:hypothetical protein